MEIQMNYKFADRMGNLKRPPSVKSSNTQDPSVIPFAAGNPAPEAFPTAEIARISNEILTKNPIAALQYSITEGVHSSAEHPERAVSSEEHHEGQGRPHYRHRHQQGPRI